MNIQTKFSLSHFKSIKNFLILSIIKNLSLSIETKLSINPFVKDAFSGVRDALVSHDKKLIYFPIPKCACTVFTTLLALNDSSTRSFRPLEEGVHDYRYTKQSLRIDNPWLYLDKNYLKFTVIRDPFSRLVSAYFDKIVRPLKPISSYEEFCSFKNKLSLMNLNFEEVVRSVCSLPDSRLEIHWRPQYLFYKNIKLDHIGVLDNIERTYKFINDNFDVDVEKDIYPLVLSPKRTKYGKIESSNSAKKPISMTAFELSRYSNFPPAEEFKRKDIVKIVENKYKTDFEIYTKNSNS